MRFLLQAIATAVVASSFAGCSALPPDGATCEATYCSDHGTCAFVDSRPTCTCAPEYIGVVCNVCAEGFAPGPNDTCVPIVTCTENACGAHGACRETRGTTVCDCAAGWDGEKCDRCYPGFHSDAGACVLDLVCLPTTCSFAGTCTASATAVTCACDEGFEGTWCETFTGSCEASDPCGEHGACLEEANRLRCRCDVGWAGAACDTCYPGFHPEEGECVLNTACGPTTCSNHGTCADAGGAATCTCETGYTGNHCERCGEGFRRDRDRCVAVQDCNTADPCVGPGTCFASGGVAGCRCDPGYAGADCTTCYPGYHRDDEGDCVLDEACFPLTCRAHGTCTAADGAVSCACDVGFTGDRCEVNVDDCANAACGSGRCVDLADGLTCLCPNGLYGLNCAEET